MIRFSSATENDFSQLTEQQYESLGEGTLNLEITEAGTVKVNENTLAPGFLGFPNAPNGSLIEIVDQTLFQTGQKVVIGRSTLANRIWRQEVEVPDGRVYTVICHFGIFTENKTLDLT